MIIKRLGYIVIQCTEEELAKATKKDEHSLLGKGSYGIVYKAYLRSTFVAIKFLSQVGSNSIHIIFTYAIDLCSCVIGRRECTMWYYWKITVHIRIRN